MTIYDINRQFIDNFLYMRYVNDSRYLCFMSRDSMFKFFSNVLEFRDTYVLYNHMDEHEVFVIYSKQSKGKKPNFI